MALCSLISTPVVVLLASALLLIDGETTTFEPYVVAIYRGSPATKTAVCTGAIIKPRDILTTASCADRAGKHMCVSTAAHDTNQAHSVGEDFFEVDKILRHPNFSSDTNMIDLAVLRLKSNIQAIKDVVSPLLVTNVGPINETTCTATHWRSQSPYTQLIRTGKPTPCTDADKPTQICVSFTEYEDCKADAEGGVLACNGKIVGVFSGKIGRKNCSKERVRFVDVTKHYNWINLPEELIQMKSAAQQLSAYHVALTVLLYAIPICY